MGVEIDPQLVENLKEKRFATVKHGCDPEQVDAFLVTIASSIESLAASLKEAEAAPSGPAEPADARSRRLERIGEVTEREVEKMLAEAKAEAAKIRSDAETEANRITREARNEAKVAVDEVQAFLDQVDEQTRTIPAAAEERRRQMIEETRTMQERLLGIAKALDGVLDTKGT
jgi:cell division septum initiation protein DivIVA